MSACSRFLSHHFDSSGSFIDRALRFARKGLPICCCCAAPILCGEPPKNGYILTYQDEFNQNSLNENEWYYRASDVVSFGGYSQKQNVSVTTGGGVGFLDIAYTREDIDGDSVADPVGGGVISRRAFGYGYYEARIKFYDEEPGLHQSFWTVGNGFYTSYNEDYKYNEDAKADRVPYVNSVVEIDVVELDSNHNSGGANFHWHTPDFSTPNGAYQGFNGSYIDTSKWITFGMEWTPGQVTIWVDDVQRHQITYSDDRYGPQPVWLTALANNREIWGGNGYPAPGASMKVDYFRFYSRPFNANLAANPGFEHNQAATSRVRNWISDDGIYDNVDADQASIKWGDGQAHQGQGYLQHTHADGAPSMNSLIETEYIPNGTYRSSAWVQRSAGVASAKMSITGYGGLDREVDLPVSGSWVEMVVDDIEVTDNRLDLSFASQGGDGTWIRVDSVELIDSDFTTVLPLEGIVVDDGDPRYQETGTWLDSSLPGYNDTQTRYSRTVGDTVQWNPGIPESGSYQVYIYKVAYTGSEPNAAITISYDGGQDTTTLDYTQGTSGWVYLGTYPFVAGDTGFVRNTAVTTNTTSRADAVMFQLAGSQSATPAIEQNGFEGRTYVIRATNLNPLQTYVLKATNDLAAGFTEIVDGPRLPTQDGDPTQEAFTSLPGSATDERPHVQFFRLETMD